MDIMSAITNGAAVLGKVAMNNLPVIQTACSLCGTILTPIWTGKSVLKAKDILDAERAKRGPDCDISKGEMVELTWKEFIGPVLLCGATCACEIKTTKDLLGKAATATALATASSKALSDYKEKNKELFGNANDQKIKNAIAQEKISEFRANGVSFPEIRNADEHVFHDPFSGRLFVCTINKFRTAVANINLALVPGGTWSSENQMQLNDFYTEINDPTHLGVLKSGYNVGWSTHNPLKYEVEWREYEDSKVVGFISYNLYDLSTDSPIMAV